jgi:hypothetical protein
MISWSCTRIVVTPSKIEMFTLCLAALPGPLLRVPMTVGLVVLEFRKHRRRSSNARLVKLLVLVLALSSSVGIKIISLLEGCR